jgi:hypothetical protein
MIVLFFSFSFFWLCFLQELPFLPEKFWIPALVVRSALWDRFSSETSIFFVFFFLYNFASFPIYLAPVVAVLVFRIIAWGAG